MNHLSASEWEVLSALFDKADELDEVALADWLQEQRAQHNPLLSHLERMLDARTQVKSDEFIERPAGASLRPPPLGDDWSAGQTVGAYRLLRALGRGGMAEVWLAERNDGAFERSVAIKLLYGESSTRRRNSFVQRFDRERDILASLNHPHIARLLDAGVTPTGQPWIALEYVQGQHLTDYCDTHRLSVRARVELFLQVLQAVQYAHANLVIHRDIKPPNILVTDRGQVQLLDFGIAKIIDSPDQHSTETELTQQAGRPLTLLYASPEQTRGEPLTVASDVYSLGVVLYQLVAGESPYELKRDSAAFLEHAIQEIDPRAPSRRALSEKTSLARSCTPESLRRTLANDLDAIVLKALSKQPEQRYSGAEALLLDLKRWLEGQAVLAKPPSQAYYLRKFVARHRLTVGLGSAAVVALLVVSSIALVFGIQATRQSERARASRDFMIEMFRQADPEKYAGREMSAKELVLTAKSTLMRQMQEQPQLQAELLHGLGVAQYNMSQYILSDQTIAESVRLLRQLDQPKELATALINHATTVYLVGDWARAKALLDDAASVTRLDRLDAHTQGKYHELMALYVMGTQDQNSAVESAEKGARLMQKALGEQNGDALRAQVVLARVQMHAGQNESARQTLERAQEWVDRFPAMETIKVINLQSNQALLESLIGTLPRAERLYDSAGVKCESVQGPQAEDCAIIRHFQTRLLLAMGDHQQALKHLPRLLGQVRSSSAPRRAAELVSTTARVIFKNQLRDSHQDVWDQLVGLSEAGPDVKQPGIFKLQALLVRAEELLTQGHVARAVALMANAQERLNVDSASAAIPLAQLGLLQGIAAAMSGRTSEAMRLTEQARIQLVSGKAPPHYTLAAQATAAVIQAGAGNIAQARDQMSAIIDTMRSKLGANSPVVQRAQSKLQMWSAGTPNETLTFVDYFY